MRIGGIKKTSYWLLGIVILLVAIRATLPWAVKTYANRVLDGIPGYYGYIDDVDLHIWRGAYSIQGVELVKTNGSVREPLFSANEVEVSLDWRALFSGRLVSKIHLDTPKLQFIVRKDKNASQTKVDSVWQEKVAKLYPFEINRLSFSDATIRYKDETRNPKIDASFSGLDMTATNISNTEKLASRLPSTVKLHGRILKSGRVFLNGKMNALAVPAEFDLNSGIHDLSLKEINDFAKAYGGFDFEKGKLDVAFELAASKTKYSGYTKTILRDVDVVDFEKERKEGDSLGKILWEDLVGGAMTIFKNQKRNQFAARVPISGSRDDLKIDSWATVGSILKNAFISALNPKLEDSVDFGDAGKDRPSQDQKAKDD
jgi:hypothetical protein